MEVTVRELLTADFFKESRLLAGNAGMENRIRTVNFLETRHSFKYYVPGTFAIASAYHFQDDNAELEILMDNLVSAEVTALGIDLESYQKLPEALRRKAEEHGLPVISIRYLYVDILDFIRNNLYLRHSQQFLHKQIISDKLHKKAKESGLKGICEVLHEWTALPVAIKYRGELTELPKCWYADTTLEECTSGDYNEDRMPGGIDSIVQHHTDGGDTREWICIRLVQNNTTVGHIAFGQLNAIFDQNDYQLLGIAKKVCEIEIHFITSIIEERRRREDQFLAAVLDGRIKDKDELQSKATEFSWNLKGEFAVVCISPVSDDCKSIDDEIVENIRNYFSARYQRDIAVAIYGSNLVVLIPDGLDALDQLVEKLVDNLEKNGGRYTVGVGRMVDSGRIARSYLEASRVVRIRMKRGVGIESDCFFFNDLGIYRFITKYNVTEDMIDFCQDYVQPIRDHDQKHNAEIYRTLLAYFAAECNPNLAAQRLYLHGNTVRYRLSLVEKLTGVDLKKQEDRFDMLLALKLVRLLEEEKL